MIHVLFCMSLLLLSPIAHARDTQKTPTVEDFINTEDKFDKTIFALQLLKEEKEKNKKEKKKNEEIQAQIAHINEQHNGDRASSQSTGLIEGAAGVVSFVAAWFGLSPGELQNIVLICSALVGADGTRRTIEAALTDVKDVETPQQATPLEDKEIQQLDERIKKEIAAKKNQTPGIVPMTKKWFRNKS